MSDCSTSAMLPKEQPKTCGTCGHSAKRHNPPTNVGHPRKNDLVCLVHAVSVSSDLGGAPMPCGIYHQEPGNWTPRTDTLEQRYQQLEQVAKSLLGIAHGAAEEIMFPSRELVAKQRRKLETLGVSLDD